MKLTSSFTALFLSTIVAAGSIILPVESLRVAIPRGSDGLDYYVEQFPLQNIFSFTPAGLQIRNYPQFGIEATLFTYKFVPGVQHIRISGRALSADSSASLFIAVHGMHWEQDSCDGSADWEKNTFEFAVDLPLGTMQQVEFPFELNDQSLRCQKCNQLLEDCRIQVSLRLNDPATEPDREEIPGIEIAFIEFLTTFEALSGTKKQIQTTTWLPELLQKEAQYRQAWQDKHNQIAAQYPADNTLAPANFFPPPQAPDTNAEWRYFSEDELRKLNPAFSMRKVASWPFYHRGFNQPEQLELSGRLNADRIFDCNGVVYAEGQSFISRWDEAASRWEYITDKTVFQSKHRPAKQYPEDIANVLYRNGKAIHLVDGSELPLPQDMAQAGSLNHGQYAAANNQVYWISADRMNIYGAAPDFTNPRALEVQWPELAGVEFKEIRNLYAYGNHHKLLVEQMVTVDYNPTSLLFELDLDTLACDLKLPAAKDGYFLRGEENGWSFTGISGRFFDLGPGLPLAACQDAAHPLIEKFQLPRIFPTIAQGEMLHEALRVGLYAVTGNAKDGKIRFLHLTEPEKSLQLHGFEHHRNLTLAPDGEGIWVTMPDGAYEVRPPATTPLPQQTEVPREDTNNKLSPQQIVTDIEAEIPALFDAAVEDDGVVFTLKPTQGLISVTLHLQLPQVANPPPYYLFHFNRDVSSIFSHNPENAAGERDASIWTDHRTMQIKSDSVKLHFFVMTPPEAQSFTLTHITEP